MIMNTTDAPVQKLNLIDTLQKLCVAYNFEEEIEDALQKIYNDSVFEKFKDDDRKFKSSLINDVQGMLNLHEAAHFAIHGEDILDEALAFTATQLKSMASRIIRAADRIARLLDDKASHRFEQKRGHVPSAVECYMKQHGVSEDVAVEFLLKQVADAWKDVNEAMLKPTAVPLPLLEGTQYFEVSTSVTVNVNKAGKL
ncbi:hypothetical protein Pint_04282 [Pistacia integerrima]|uniref:Uncharacterized protein n=1 Tax=Pistacia integerrima TaxID=434235 RepID=A0ACC0Z5K4_9ROSI|nr:hypothetical protein Pint_04282 [Pistacia integerrima]